MCYNAAMVGWRDFVLACLIGIPVFVWLRADGDEMRIAAFYGGIAAGMGGAWLARRIWERVTGHSL